MKHQTKYKISGHETFPFRYAWLPKAVKIAKNNPKIYRFFFIELKRYKSPDILILQMYLFVIIDREHCKS